MYKSGTEARVCCGKAMDFRHGRFVCSQPNCTTKREPVSLLEPGTVLGGKSRRRLTLKDLGAPVTTLPQVQEGNHRRDPFKHGQTATFVDRPDGRLKGHSNPKAEKIVRGVYDR